MCCNCSYSFKFLSKTFSSALAEGFYMNGTCLDLRLSGVAVARSIVLAMYFALKSVFADR